ncbi:Arylsulfatase [Thalassoglobus neptunius]|uniref:Arylsulfatase n=1 Tax=Thalassoglobus neptunius TaxID=1938619 RepID=A0A5C5X4G7_9PLAN|nr:sulfatase-like hydrolase/transferase [Thalassoglobus neptunius]TWT57123.1 Arylsulfatase [Thalassoglobus neptunius]
MNSLLSFGLAIFGFFGLLRLSGSRLRTTSCTLVAVTLLAVLLAGNELSAELTERPNILVILADDLGYGDVGCYNAESKVPTPHVDALASQGMKFTDAHSPSTVCTPTRYSLLTGQMAFRLNYRGVFSGAGGPCLISGDQFTLPEMLREEGYATAMFGKWHVGMTFFDEQGEPISENGLKGVERIDYSRPIPDGPVNHGFDQFFGTACCPTTDWLYAYIEGDRIPVPPVDVLDRSQLPKHEWSFDCRPGLVASGFDHEEVDQVFLKKSLEFLDDHVGNQPEKPFFLFHSMQAVHLPSFPGKDYQGKTDAGPHGDFIFEFDDIVGQLVKKLSELGIAEKTIVIVTSDNGPEVGTVVNMRRRYQHDGANPWRGMKRDNWEGGHRVPLIVRWPGIVKAGTVSVQLVCLTDIMATCAEVTGVSLPDDTAEDSISFLAALKGEDSDTARDFILHQTISLALAIRKGPWKFLDHKSSGGNRYNSKQLQQYALPESAPDAPGQLYHLENDPGERHNLYNDEPEIVAELQALLEECKVRGNSRFDRN